MKKNAHIVAFLLLAGLTMGAVAYASVPLYRMFCSATGYGGTTQRAETAPTKTVDRVITVNFDTNVDSALPWDFTPDVRHIDVKLGETRTVTFHAHNRSDKTLVGMATFNVQPDKAGSYFSKLQCFCFDKQVLKAGESAEMAVEFYIDPAIMDDKYANDVQNITLSYTMFLAKDQTITEKKSVPTAQPNPTPRNPT